MKGRISQSRLALSSLLLAGACVVIGLETVTGAQSVFNVRDFGATGNGTTNDAPAINKAIAAANGAGGGIVSFPAGTYRSASIHLKSNVTLRLDSGATIRAASSGFDSPEPNSFDAFQDFGHSHFHDALIWGENLQNIGIVGAGTIDGGGNLMRSNSVPSGQADKALSLKLCNGVTLTDITMRHGGHFAILANGCTNMTLARLRVLTSTDRDAINIINCSHVKVTDSQIEGSDDSMVLKSDFALGKKILNEDIHISNCTILSTENNATQFGSETCGDYRNISWSNLTLTAARKAGIGITANDGAVIDNVTYNDITMVNCTTPIFMKLDDQGRCPGNPPLGRIRNISIANVTATHSVQGGREFTSAISGKPGIPIENVRLTNVKLVVPGGHPSSDSTRVPPENDDWTPKSLGTRPAYGWYLRHVRGISFIGCEVDFDANDGRPAFVCDDGQSVVLDGFKAERGSSSPFDVGFSDTNGFCVTNSSTTGGSDLRINTDNSTRVCTPKATICLEAESGTVGAPLQVLNDADASGGRFIEVAGGNNSQSSPPTTGIAVYSFSVPFAASYKVWGRVIAPDKTGDSFWIRVDNGAWVKWNNIPLGADWHWDDVHNSDAGDAVVAFNLSAGAHTLRVAYREEGARLDRLMISNDVSAVPNDGGPSLCP